MISQRVKERFPSLFWDSSSLDRLREIPDITLRANLLKRTISFPQAAPNHTVVSSNRIKDSGTGAQVEITEVTVPKKKSRNQEVDSQEAKKLMCKAGTTIGKSFEDMAKSFSKLTDSVVPIGDVLKEMGFLDISVEPPDLVITKFKTIPPKKLLTAFGVVEKRQSDKQKS